MRVINPATQFVKVFKLRITLRFVNVPACGILPMMIQIIKALVVLAILTVLVLLGVRFIFYGIHNLLAGIGAFVVAAGIIYLVIALDDRQTR